MLKIANSENFTLVNPKDETINILKIYVNNTLMLLLIPELSGKKAITNLSYKGSIEYMSIILDFLNAMVQKPDFTLAYMQILKEYEFDILWYIVWYVSYIPDEKYFINAALLLSKIITVLFPINFQPLFTERYFFSII